MRLMRWGRWVSGVLFATMASVTSPCSACAGGGDGQPAVRAALRPANEVVSAAEATEQQRGAIWLHLVYSAPPGGWADRSPRIGCAVRITGRPASGPATTPLREDVLEYDPEGRAVSWFIRWGDQPTHYELERWFYDGRFLVQTTRLVGGEAYTGSLYVDTIDDFSYGHDDRLVRIVSRNLDESGLVTREDANLYAYADGRLIQSTFFRNGMVQSWVTFSYRNDHLATERLQYAGDNEVYSTTNYIWDSDRLAAVETVDLDGNVILRSLFRYDSEGRLVYSGDGDEAGWWHEYTYEGGRMVSSRFIGGGTIDSETRYEYLPSGRLARMAILRLGRLMEYIDIHYWGECDRLSWPAYPCVHPVWCVPFGPEGASPGPG